MWDHNMCPLQSSCQDRHVWLDPVTSQPYVHLCSLLCRLPAECLLLAHVPSEDSEWSRDGSCPDFSQGILLFVKTSFWCGPSAAEHQNHRQFLMVPEELNTWPGAATRCFPRDTSVPSAAALSRGQGADCGLLGSWTATLGLERCACFHLGSGCFSNSLYKSQHLSLKLFNVPELARDAATLCCL